MKELSIEEKAKAYDEALERAKILYNDKNEFGYANAESVLEEVFPLLKESEDERIRKELIEHCRNTRCVTEEGAERIAKWISWLEKQEGCEYIKKDWLEHIKQSWYKEGFIDGKYSNKTPKEWTINDATTLNELIDFLENGTAKLQHDLTKYANWLKIQFTPFEKQGEQKPAWSEEDERMYKAISIALSLKDAKGYLKSWYTTPEEADKWLTSLKDRYSWKPSDEQMKQLGWISEQNKDNMIGKELISLYQDLKKLKEE